jgi:hypothetical protein
MSKKIVGVLALAGMCAMSFFLLSCGSSSSRPSGVLYAVTQGSSGDGNNISSFAMDLNNGSLTLLNSDISTCTTAATTSNPSPCGLGLQIVLDPTGATAFLLNQGLVSASVAPTIVAYTVGSDGSLGSPSLAATLATGDTPVAMVRDAAGQFLFVIDQGSSPSPGYPTPSMGNPSCPHASTGPTDICPSIMVFAMQPGSTSLTLASGPIPLSKIPTGLAPVVFTPAGTSTTQEMLFVTNNLDICTTNCVLPQHSDNTVSVYNVSSSGVLSEQSTSPYIISVPDPVSVLAVNTNSSNSNSGAVFVYVGNSAQNGGDVNPFQLCTAIGNAGCTAQQVQNTLLVPLVEACTQPPCNNVAPSAVGKEPVQMVVDPTNNFLYVLSEGSNQVFGYKINPTAGTLAATIPANQSTGLRPVSMALHPSVNNTGQFLFTSNNGGDSISGFTLSTTSGAMGSPTTLVAPAAPSGLAVH